MADRGPVLLYHETQRFTQPWMWALLIGLAALQCCIFGQVLLPGHHATPDDPPLWLACAIVGFVAVALPLFIFSCCLTTQVRRDALLLQFVPFHLRPLAVDYRAITSCQAVKYNPLLDYGGWGLRSGAGGKAYNVTGNLGVRLEFTTGQALLIGSRHPLELAAAINAARTCG
jgi:hypothetical protein